jgi:hypothetical protein
MAVVISSANLSFEDSLNPRPPAGNGQLSTVTEAYKSPRPCLSNAAYVAKVDDVPFVNTHKIGAICEDFLKQTDIFGRENNLATLEMDVGIVSISNEADNLPKVGQLACRKGRKPKGGLHGFIF